MRTVRSIKWVGEEREKNPEVKFIYVCGRPAVGHMGLVRGTIMEGVLFQYVGKVGKTRPGIRVSPDPAI